MWSNIGTIACHTPIFALVASSWPWSDWKPAAGQMWDSHEVEKDDTPSMLRTVQNDERVSMIFANVSGSLCMNALALFTGEIGAGLSKRLCNRSIYFQQMVLKSTGDEECREPFASTFQT